MIENITHTAKQTVKAVVLAVRIEICFVRVEGMVRTSSYACGL
jgi:hypothetical protein